MEKFPNNIVDEVIKRNDIVNVVGEYVNLEKQGKNFFGLCPFHSEKTPSFSVSPEKQIFHCFSCGEGGNVIQFISKIENISQTESIKKLARKINLKIEGFIDDNKSNEDSKYFEINKFVCDYYQFALLNTIEGKKALDYLKSRNINEDIIRKFRIGLAPDSINSLYQALKSNSYSELSMIELGHVNKINNKFYDKFKNRIMFPITDEFSNILGFSGRIYLDNDKSEHKYINTQETPIFRKGNIIYNLDNAKKYLKQNNKVFLFEGFMDVIASVKSGLDESVATMGTSLTSNHVSLLKKYTNNFVVCYDGDNAGIEATKRAIDILNKQNVNVSVINFPEGLDPDDYVNKYGNKEYFDFIYNNLKSYKEYMYVLYYKNINLNNIASIEDFKKKVFQLIATSSPTEKELFLNKLSNDINVSVQTLNFDFNKYTQYVYKSDTPSNYDIVTQDIIFKTIEKKRPKKKKLLEAQKIMLFFCLYNIKYFNIINNDSSIRFKDDSFRRLFYDLADYYKLYDKLYYDEFIKKYGKENKEYIDLIQNIYSDYLEYNTESFKIQHLEECFAVIINDNIADYVANLRNKLRSTESEEEKVKISQQIIEHYKIIKVKK